MFTTYRSAEITIKGLEQNQRSQLWSCVEQEAIHPWYYLQIGRWGRKAHSSSMMMVHHAHELRDLVDSQSNLTWLEQVQFVCPPHMNGKNFWTMEHLERISVLGFPDSDDYDIEISVTGGNSYYLNGIGRTYSATVNHVLFEAVRDIRTR